MTSAMMLHIRTKDGAEYDRAATFNHGFSLSGSFECIKRAANFIRMIQTIISPHLEIIEASIFSSNDGGWVKINIS